MHSTDMYINGSINPEQSLFVELSKDTSLNTISNSSSLDRLGKRYSSCRSNYVGYSRNNKLNPVESFRTGKKVTIDYLSQYNQRLKRNDEVINDLSPLYHLEVQQAQKLRTELNLKRKKIIEKGNSCSDLRVISDLVLACDCFGRMIVKSSWFSENGRTQASNNFHCLEKQVFAAAEEIFQSWEGLKNLIKKNQDKKTENQEIIEENKELRKKVSEFEKHQKKSLKKSNNELKIIQKKEREWVIEKVRFELEIEALNNEIQKYLGIISSFEEKINSDENSKYQEQIQALNGKIESLQNKIFHFQYSTGQLKMELSEKEQALAGLTNKLVEQEKSMKNLEVDPKPYEELINSYKNQLQMQNEDLLSHYFLKSEFQLLKISFKALKANYEQLLTHESQDSFSEDNTKVPLTDLIFSVGATSGIRQNLQMNFENFKFIRPTFSEMLNLPNVDNAEYYPPFKNWIFVMIRGIYDSKFYEHSLCYSSVNSSPTRFLDFVYSWIGCYGIEENSRNVIELEWWKKDKANEIRFTFLLGLASEKYKNCWEISTFKEFLNEDMMLDELGFFLHCRFLLLKSPQLLTSTGKYSKNQKMNLAKVLEVIEKLMKRASSLDLNKLLMLIQEKASKNKLIPTIDLALVLRICLEFYRQEKKQKFWSIQKLFSDAPNEPNGLSYFSFRNICKNLSTELSEYTITKFYRDCWSISKGRITPETFFIVSNETSILYQFLKLPGDNSYNEVRNSGNKSSIYWKKMEIVINEFRNNEKEIELIKYGIDCMGIENLSERVNKMIYLLQNPDTCPIEEYWFWNLEDIYHRFWGIITNSSLSFIECNSQDMKLLAYKLSQSQKSDLNYIKNSSQLFLDILLAMNLTKIKNNIAARRIQQLWKKKAGKSITLIETVLKSVKKFKKLSIKNK